MPTFFIREVHGLKTKKRLDLVEFIFEFKEVPDLENIIIIGAQHILPSTLIMLESFFDRGLSPKNVFLIGKCYSTDYSTYKQLIDLGVYVCPSSLVFDKYNSFDSSYSYYIKSFVNQVFREISLLKNELIVAIDDGGELISYLNNCKLEHQTFVGLEQTTSGYQKIKLLNLNIGVVNVARSHAKLQFESKIVAKTAISEIYNKLSSGINNIKNTLIIGNGAIGNAVANALEGNFNIFISDSDPNKSNAYDKENLPNLSEFDLIIGCVGNTVLSFDKIKQLKEGAILASLSSSDREFEIVQPRSQSTYIRSCHDDFIWKGIRVLNCGFPRNSLDVDIEEFELTRSLLTLGILQAIKLKFKKGLFSMCDSDQKKLIDQYLTKYSLKKMK